MTMVNSGLTSNSFSAGTDFMAVSPNIGIQMKRKDLTKTIKMSLN